MLADYSRLASFSLGTTIMRTRSNLPAHGILAVALFAAGCGSVTEKDPDAARIARLPEYALSLRQLMEKHQQEARTVAKDVQEGTAPLQEKTGEGQVKPADFTASCEAVEKINKNIEGLKARLDEITRAADEYFQVTGLKIDKEILDPEIQQKTRAIVESTKATFIEKLKLIRSKHDELDKARIRAVSACKAIEVLKSLSVVDEKIAELGAIGKEIDALLKDLSTLTEEALRLLAQEEAKRDQQ